jgi:sorbitol-specific phosphotransferase system component IIA
MMSAPQIAALDFARFEAIAELADLAASYWRSIAEAALRGEQLTLEVHCRQVAAVTRETFATVKSLGHEVDREQEAA